MTGRRLFFTNEVERYGPPDKTPDKLRILLSPDPTQENGKKILDFWCERLTDQIGNQLAHSKSVFAQKVLLRESPFDKFDMSEFGLIFQVIENILAAPAADHLPT
jgi:hypothetical protein